MPKANSNKLTKTVSVILITLLTGILPMVIIYFSVKLYTKLNSNHSVLNQKASKKAEKLPDLPKALYKKELEYQDRRYRGW